MLSQDKLNGCAMNKIIPIKAFKDNYIWCIQSTEHHQVAVVDPGDAQPVFDYLTANNLQLSAILVTHHHFDHVGGVEQLKAHYQCPVYGPYNDSLSMIDVRLAQGQQLSLDFLDNQFEIIELPGHTLDHIAFYDASKSQLFCGDTLFAAGCGRLFEGTPSQMYNSLAKLTKLPANTKVYCTHEYTLDNLNFALTVEPDNQQLQKRLEQCKQLRDKDQPTLPSDITTELATNPFLRADQPAIKASAEQQSNAKLSSNIDVFAQIRRMKDSF
jgi:hydroxyacylglutathione hydrolase